MHAVSDSTSYKYMLSTPITLRSHPTLINDLPCTKHSNRFLHDGVITKTRKIVLQTLQGIWWIFTPFHKVLSKRQVLLSVLTQDRHSQIYSGHIFSDFYLLQEQVVRSPVTVWHGRYCVLPYECFSKTSAISLCFWSIEIYLLPASLYNHTWNQLHPLVYDSPTIAVPFLIVDITATANHLCSFTVNSRGTLQMLHLGATPPAFYGICILLSSTRGCALKTIPLLYKQLEIF